MEREWPQVLRPPLRPPEGTLYARSSRGRLRPTEDPYARYCGVGIRLLGWLPGYSSTWRFLRWRNITSSQSPARRTPSSMMAHPNPVGVLVLLVR